MALSIDDVGRKVIDVPFQTLERNPEWTGAKELPYKMPENGFILPRLLNKDNKADTISPQADENVYLCVEGLANNVCVCMYS